MVSVFSWCILGVVVLGEAPAEKVLVAWQEVTSITVGQRRTAVLGILPTVMPGAGLGVLQLLFTFNFHRIGVWLRVRLWTETSWFKLPSAGIAIDVLSDHMKIIMTTVRLL